MKTIITCTRTILISVVFSLSAFADSGINKATIYGSQNLKKLESGNTANIVIKSYLGLVKINLTKNPKVQNTGSVILSGQKRNAPAVDIDLFTGQILNLRKANIQGNVTASIYKNKLKVVYQGSKLKKHTLIFDLNKLNGRPLVGKLSRKTTQRKSDNKLSVLLDANDLTTTNTSIIPRSTSDTLLLGIEADYEFFQDNGSNVNDTIAKLQEITNDVSSVFSSQLGLNIALHDYNIYADDTQPYVHDTNDGIEMITELRNYFVANPTYLDGDYKVMLTGKDICYPGLTEDDCNAELNIISYTKALCKTSTYNLGIIDNVYPEYVYKQVAVLLARNLGAEVDDSNPPTLMNSTDISTATSFSNQSITEMTNYMNRHNQCFIGGGENNILKYKIKLNSKNKFTMSALAQNFDTDDCDISFYAASSIEKLNSEPVLFASNDSEENLIVDDKIKFKFLFSTRRPSSNLYTQAVATCGEVETKSAVKTITPKAGNASAKFVIPSKFIEYLKKRLQ